MSSLLLAAVPRSMLVASGYPEAWSLKLLAVDHDPGAELRPVIAHDLEFSRDGLQLAW